MDIIFETEQLLFLHPTIQMQPTSFETQSSCVSFRVQCGGKIPLRQKLQLRRSDAHDILILAGTTSRKCETAQIVTNTHGGDKTSMLSEKNANMCKAHYFRSTLFFFSRGVINFRTFWALRSEFSENESASFFFFQSSLWQSSRNSECNGSTFESCPVRTPVALSQELKSHQAPSQSRKIRRSPKK